VQAMLETMAKQNRPFEPKAGGKAEEGDRLTIAFVGTIDGEKFDGGTADDIQLELGSKTFIPGFEDQLLGVEAGGEKTVNVTFPTSYAAQHLAGKAAEFQVTVKSIEQPGERAIDEEFAKMVGFEDLAKLRAAIVDRLKGEYAMASRRRVKRELLDALDERHSFDLPQSLVDQEFEVVWRQITQDLEVRGKTFADDGTTEEKARDEYRKIAERRVRLGLVLAEIGEKAQIKVTDEEVSRAVVERARQFPGQEQQVWDYYRKSAQALASLRAPIFEEKVVDYILELAEVTEKTVSKDELFKDNEDEEAA
jgi:trigger factor